MRPRYRDLIGANLRQRLLGQPLTATLPLLSGLSTGVRSSYVLIRR